MHKPHSVLKEMIIFQKRQTRQIYLERFLEGLGDCVRYGSTKQGQVENEGEWILA